MPQDNTEWVYQEGQMCFEAVPHHIKTYINVAGSLQLHQSAAIYWLLNRLIVESLIWRRMQEQNAEEDLS